MEKKELWVQNLTKTDKKIGDLGVKIATLRTVNIYAFNPYLTEERVNNSLKLGSLAKYIKAGLVKIVKKAVTTRPHTLDQIKASKEPIKAIKTKSSVVIQGTIEENEKSPDAFDFADYGVGDLVDYKKEGSSIVVSQKLDEEPKQENSSSDLLPKMEVGQNSRQTQIVMDTAEKAIDPTGPIAEPSSSSNQKFVVFQPPKKETENDNVIPLVDKDAQGNDPVKPAFNRVDLETPSDEAIKFKEVDTGIKVATKSEDGSIVMEVKTKKKKKKVSKKRSTSKKK